MATQPTPDELRRIADGDMDTGSNEPCPFCGTERLITRIGDHIHTEHHEELYRAVAVYREQ